MPYHSGNGGHGCRSLVLAQAVSTVLIQSGGGGWRRSRGKGRYSDRYQMLCVQWCRVMGVTCLATVWLLVGTEQRDEGSLSQPSRKGLSCGRGNVARASILEPDGDLLKVLKGDVVWGSASQWWC